MKKKKIPYALLLTFLLTLLLLCSCEANKDFLEDNNSHGKILSVRNAKFETLIKEKNFKDLLDKTIHFSDSFRTAFEELNGFTISEGYVKIIETDSVISYTMHITLDSITNTNSFENLVIQESKFSQEEIASIYKYIPNSIILSADNVFEGTIQKMNLSSAVGTTTSSFFGQGACFINILMCNEAEEGGTIGPGHVVGQDCNDIDYFYVRPVEVLCPESGENGGGGDPTGVNPSGGTPSGGTPSGGTPSGGTPTVATPIYTIPIIGFEPDCDGSIDCINTNKYRIFKDNLLPTQSAILNNNLALNTTFFSYLSENEFSPESIISAIELIDLGDEEANQADVINLTNLAMRVDNSGDNFFTDEFELSLDPYLDIDVATFQNEHFPGLLAMKYHMDYKRLRQLNPEWSRIECAWEAGKGIVHISLDAFGLIPVGGEIADLLNGVLYTIEGDNVSATLSYASAIPIVGWASVTTKYAIKIKTYSGVTMKLVWKKLPNGVIYFGSNNHCRATLRKVLGLTVGNANIAHHIIPLNKQGNEVIQKAAKSTNAFHMNEALNGIPLNATVHSGSHPNYDILVQDRLQSIINLYGPNMTPNQAYNGLTDLISDIRTAIQNNPNTPINQLNF